MNSKEYYGSPLHLSYIQSFEFKIVVLSDIFSLPADESNPLYHNFLDNDNNSKDVCYLVGSVAGLVSLRLVVCVMRVHFYQHLFIANIISNQV